MTKNVDYYVSLPYKVVLYPAKEGGFVVEIPDLPGCITQGDELDEAYHMLEDAKKAWIETALEEGIEIPEPRSEEAYSGKFNVRVPKSLHRAMVKKAAAENVSLNQLILFELARGIDKPLKKHH